MPEVVRIEGLKELQGRLRKLDGQSQKQLRLVLNEAADIVVTHARPLVPRRTGRAAASIKARSQQRKAIVKAGGSRVPYYAWLDFGGAVGRKNSIRRDFLKDGRYLYPTLSDRRGEIQDKMEQGLNELIRKAGL